MQTRNIAERCSYKHIQITVIQTTTIIEHAREYEDVMHMNIYIKFNDERYVSRTRNDTCKTDTNRVPMMKTTIY